LRRWIWRNSINIKKLNEGRVKEGTIKNKFTALENLEDNGTSIRHAILLERTSKFWTKEYQAL
jgi:hypothetical protein